MICENCGFNNPDDAVVCSACGHSTTDSTVSVFTDNEAQQSAPQAVAQEPVPQVPAYQTPTYQAPAYQQPVYQQPVYQQPVYQQPVYQQPMYQQPMMPVANTELEEPVTVGDWMVSTLILCIPIVGLVMLFVWAFGSGTKKSKANFFKASLLWTAIYIGIFVLFFLLLLLAGEI